MGVGGEKGGGGPADGGGNELMLIGVARNGPVTAHDLHGPVSGVGLVLVSAGGRLNVSEVTPDGTRGRVRVSAVECVPKVAITTSPEIRDEMAQGIRHKK